MAVRDDFAAGEVLAAADLNDTFAEKLPYSYGTATPSTTDSGFLWYDSNSTPAATKFWDGSGFVPFGGKVRQIVRATDSTNRSTTSTSMVDVTGMSVTITPQQSTSAIIVIATGRADADPTFTGFARLSDSSGNLLSGSGDAAFYATSLIMPFVLIGYATPATTSATTYKMQFRVANAAGTFEIENSPMNGQILAIEVAA